MTPAEAMALPSADMMHHTMEGLPSWVFYLSLAAMVVMTIAIQRARDQDRDGRGWRFELTALAPIRWLLSKRPFQFALQVPLVLALTLILYAGFFGTRVPERNIATILTWTIWWTLLIVDIVLLGRMWCLVCPWEALAAWTRRLAFWRRTDEALSLELKWPRVLSNIYPATFLFVGLTWLELGYGVTMSPRATAVLGLGMVLLAVVPALFFERRSFCKYGCLIGRICGLYSMLAPVEVRARNQAVCKSCASKDCLHGNERGYPCPTGQYLGTMNQNTYCTVCTECVKSCPHDNVALHIRPWGADLKTLSRPKRDEALLALVLLSLTSFHGFTMTPTWTNGVAWFQTRTGLGWLASFSMGMGLILVVPGALFFTLSAVAARGIMKPKPLRILSRRPFSRVAVTYAYAVIPIALMYHLAHNAGHFLTEVGKIIPVLSDPLGRGSDFFNTRTLHVGPLVSQTTIWILMVLLVLVGHLWSMRTLARAHDRVAKAGGQIRVPRSARFAVSAFVLLASATNLWLLAQPMEMRTGM